jgi:hypothetical protein
MEMKFKFFRRLSFLTLVLMGGCGTAQQSQQAAAPEAPPQIIELTQTGCQFLETEAQDYQYKTTKADDCKKINRDTLAEREAQFKPLQLKPGAYIFRVTNRDVPYDLGFYLRGSGAKVSGGGLKPGVTKDYEATLIPGEYKFSCPLNPTPDYPLIVQ